MWRNDFTQEMWLLFIEKAKLDSMFYKNGTKTGLDGEIPKSSRGVSKNL